MSLERQKFQQGDPTCQNGENQTRTPPNTGVIGTPIPDTSRKVWPLWKAFWWFLTRLNKHTLTIWPSDHVPSHLPKGVINILNMQNPHSSFIHNCQSLDAGVSTAVLLVLWQYLDDKQWVRHTTFHSKRDSGYQCVTVGSSVTTNPFCVGVDNEEEQRGILELKLHRHFINTQKHKEARGVTWGIWIRCAL